MKNDQLFEMFKDEALSEVGSAKIVGGADYKTHFSATDESGRTVWSTDEVVQGNPQSCDSGTDVSI